MKFKKISVRILIVILPVIIVAMLSLGTIAGVTSREIISDEISKQMNSELQAETTKIMKEIEEVSTIATSISNSISSSYTLMPIEKYEKILEKSISQSNIILGSGIWFEPYVYDKNKKYVGPYVYKKDDKIVTTYEYSNEKYNYFNQEYYVNSKNATKPVFTEAYYDETTDKTMSSCYISIVNEKNEYIGCITVDIDLTSIQNVISDIKFGQSGRAYMVNSKGLYLVSDEEDKVMETLISEDSEGSVAAFGKKLLENAEGRYNGEYTKNGTKYNAYAQKIDKLGWTIIMEISQDELNSPVRSLLVKLFIIGLLTIVCAVLAVLSQVLYLTKNIKNVGKFAAELSDGNFTIDTLNIKTEDELGKMGSALNKMYLENKSVIQTISNESDELDDSSKRLDTVTEKLLNYFVKIKESISEINGNMMTSSAAVQELTASVEEVNSNIIELSSETEKCNDMTNNINDRAKKVRSASNEAFEKSNKLSKEFEERLNSSIESSRVVESIGGMAEVVANIAKQINLLSLNASIEAARAGEQGKGFAVVAAQIGKLANETSTTVDEIQKTIKVTQDSIQGLMLDSKEMLEFVRETVTPDYNSFVGVAEQYGEDAEAIEKFTSYLGNMALGIKNTMNEISLVIQNIAESAQDTSDSSNNIMEDVDLVSNVVDEVKEMAEEQVNISKTMDTMVSKFKF